MENWYKLQIILAHQGAGSREEAIAYVYARDIIGARRRHQRMRGVKRSILPSISTLSATETKELEGRIIEEGIMSLDEAKKRWYIVNK